MRLALCAVACLQEWHQKLHNNTTPDDVIICEGLLAYMAAGLDVKGAAAEAAPIKALLFSPSVSVR
jgi:hypothetical protein